MSPTASRRYGPLSLASSRCRVAVEGEVLELRGQAAAVVRGDPGHQLLAAVPDAVVLLGSLVAQRLEAVAELVDVETVRQPGDEHGAGVALGEELPVDVGGREAEGLLQHRGRLDHRRARGEVRVEAVGQELLDVPGRRAVVEVGAELAAYAGPVGPRVARRVGGCVGQGPLEVGAVPVLPPAHPGDRCGGEEDEDQQCASDHGQPTSPRLCQTGSPPAVDGPRDGVRLVACSRPLAVRVRSSRQGRWCWVPPRRCCWCTGRSTTTGPSPRASSTAASMRPRPRCARSRRRPASGSGSACRCAASATRSGSAPSWCTTGSAAQSATATSAATSRTPRSTRSPGSRSTRPDAG